MEKPKTIEKYKIWLKNNLNFEVDIRLENYYNSVTKNMLNDLETSKLWQEQLKKLVSYNEEYYINSKGYDLLAFNGNISMVIKPFESLIEKTYRKNILLNKNFPNPPQEGWITPENWFQKINDILRGVVVVKYLDGVEFLSEKIELFNNENGNLTKKFFEARDEGYYAAHLYIRHEFEIPKMEWDTKKVEVQVEVQITTQLQEVIRRLLHEYYEKKRSCVTKEKIKWQWNYKSDEFSANYLGHIIHYIEGMILEIRDKRVGDDK